MAMFIGYGETAKFVSINLKLGVHKNRQMGMET